MNLKSSFEKFLKEREHISLVEDEYGTIRGLVTMEDIIETILGLEIVDETDLVVDLQALARKRKTMKNKKPPKIGLINVKLLIYSS